MMHYSENQVKLLQREFKSLKRYIDKLFFFDSHFGIIPFSFPAFDPALSFFFEDSKTGILTAIFKKERNNPALTERLFPLDEEYRFSIKPANSNCAVYSTYILSKFLSTAPVFGELINKKKVQSSVRKMLDEANGIINAIEYKLQNEYDKSLKLHCMTVFYKGFYDAFIKRLNLPEKKRKFTELYLYAQGILYEKYLEILKDQYTDQQAGNAVVKSLPVLKTRLLKEFGVIELLKKKYAIPDIESFEEKLSEIL